MEQRTSGDATVAGIDGGGGRCSAAACSTLHLRTGARRSESTPTERCTSTVSTLAGTWQGSGQRRILGINEAPRAKPHTLYTRDWGTRTPAESGGAYAVLQPFPATAPNTALTATVTSYLQGGNQPIPADGAVPGRARVTRPASSRRKRRSGRRSRSC